MDSEQTFFGLSYRRWMVCLLPAAFAVRVLAAFQWQTLAQASQNFLQLGDSHSYWYLAQQIGSGQPYQYGSPNASIFRAPLLPLLLAPLTWIPDPWLAVFSARCLGALLGTIAAALVFEMARRLAGLPAATVACGLAAFYPGAIGMSVLILSEMLFIPLMLGHLLMWMRAWTAQSGRTRVLSSLLCGLIAGLAILTRPSWLLFIPFATALGILIGPRRKMHWQIGILTLLAAALIMSPWWMRNASLTGKLVLTTLQVGPSLMDGLREGATGASDQGMQFMDQVIEDQARLDATSRASLEGSFEWRVNRRATLVAAQWAMENPAESFLLAVRKFRRTWSLWPDGADLASNRQKLAITTSFLVVFLLSIAGTWQQRAQPAWVLAICWLPCLYFTLLHMVFVGSIRYREPAMIALLALAGCGLANWIKQLKSRSEELERVGL